MKIKFNLIVSTIKKVASGQFRTSGWLQFCDGVIFIPLPALLTFIQGRDLISFRISPSRKETPYLKVTQLQRQRFSKPSVSNKDR